MLKPVTFYSEGVKLAGDLFLPADIKPGERRAGIVLCHGYTGVRSIYLPDNARVLAEAGYVVLTFDYKGWGDSDGAKSRRGQEYRVAYAAMRPRDGVQWHPSLQPPRLAFRPRS
jgi:predicted alpha/beta hydrolase